MKERDHLLTAQGKEKVKEWFCSIHTHVVNALELNHIMQADILEYETAKISDETFRLPLFNDGECPYWYRRACEDTIAIFAALLGKYDFISEEWKGCDILSGIGGYTDADMLDVCLCERFRELYNKCIKV